MTDMSDLELLTALGVEEKKEKKKKYTAKEERIIAGFEEIQSFVTDNARLPSYGEDKNIFERIYAVRLDQIKKQPECHELICEMDHQNLLEGSPANHEEIDSAIADDELLAQLGVEAKDGDVTVLKHVRTRAEVRAAEEIASRIKCEDFEKFKPLFTAVQNELDTAVRDTIFFRKDAGFAKTDIKKHQFIIVGGQTAYIAELGEAIKAPNGDSDARLQVIYSNGTQSNILLRSLIRAMYKDETSRLISDPNSGPLFSGRAESDDLPSGTIYVLRSMSDHPTVKKHREILHKIGVTGGDVKRRIANARNDATYLLADVEIIATYKLANINRVKIEKMLHKVFSNAKLEIQINDRFGSPVSPQEWFLAPVFIIDEVINKIVDGTIGNYIYNIETAKLLLREGC